MRYLFFFLLLTSPATLFAQNSVHEVKAIGWRVVAAKPRPIRPPPNAGTTTTTSTNVNCNASDSSNVSCSRTSSSNTNPNSYAAGYELGEAIGGIFAARGWVVNFVEGGGYWFEITCAVRSFHHCYHLVPGKKFRVDVDGNKMRVYGHVYKQGKPTKKLRHTDYLIVSESVLKTPNATKPQAKKKEPPSTITFSSSDIASQAVPPRTSPATVCSFIKHQMATSITQIPTLCSVLTGVRFRYDLEVFSPTNVLEGRMRRAWSTALFQTAQALFIDGALNGVCKASTGWTGCTLRVSDSYLSERHVHYTIDSFISTLGQQMEEGGPASDQWYLRWWEYAMGEESRDQLFQSKEPVDQMGTNACREYLKAVGADPQFLAEELPPPTCSVISTTRSSLYVMIGLGNQSLAILPVNSPYVTVLPETFGRALYASGISGSVILKSSWFGEGDEAMRIYSMLDLNGIKLAWQETSSGVRNEFQALLLLTSVYMNSGQTRRKTLDVGKTIQTAAVVKLTAVPGTNADLLDLTDGSEWSVSSGTAQQCLRPGTTVVVGETRRAGKESKTVGWLDVSARAAVCHELHAAFMGAW